MFFFIWKYIYRTDAAGDAVKSAKKTADNLAGQAKKNAENAANQASSN